MARLHLSLSVWAVVLLAVSSLVIADRCVPEKHLKGFYFACREDNTRDMGWYWDDRDCDASGLETPPRKVNLPCNIQCPAGKYLPYGEAECASCRPGTYSMGGGARFQHFDVWPHETNAIFRTWCGHLSSWDAALNADEPECIPWQLGGTFMDSGNLTGISQVYSVLVSSFVISNENGGYVKFRYSADSLTHTDGFYVQEDSRTPIHLANTAEYKDVTLYFTSGLHFVSWIYYKDAKIAERETTAKLDLIEIGGLRTADDECSECTPGYYSNFEEEDECLPCTFNTYSPGFAATQCLACPADQYALKAQPSCLIRDDPCDADDYEVLYTECTESSPNVWSRSKAAHWIEPQFCLENGETVLPPTESGLSCAKCKPGFQATNLRGDCAPCPRGLFSDGEHSCEGCAPGSAALPQLTFNTWDEWDAEYFYTDCEGDDCTTQGWELASTHIHSGRYPGKRVDVWVGMVTEIGSFGGRVTFTFSLKHGSRNAYLQFLIDGYYGGLYRQDVEHETYTFDLEPGLRTLVWNFHRADNADSQPEAKATIESIVVSGTVAGGASSCVPCPAGFYQPAENQDTCLPCPTGSFSSSSSQTQCTRCEGNSYTSRPGQPSCRACGSGSVHNDQRSDCTVSCRFVSSDKRTFDIRPLNTGVHYFPSYRNGSYFMINFCDRLPASSCDGKTPFVCESRTITNNLNEKFEFLIDSGNFFEFRDTSNPQTHNFELHYLDGSYEECAAGGSRKSIIQFACNADTTELQWEHIQSDGCNNLFRATTQFACPVCTDSDFTENRGDCKDGSRTITFEKKKASICYGLAPAAVTEQCGDIEIGLGMVIMVSIIVLAVVLILVAIIAIVFRKKQQLEHKYSQLKATNTDSGVHVEMQNAGDNSIGDA